MKPTAIIVDDEPLGLRRLRTLIEADGRIEITAQCSDAESAIAAINSRRPDAVFLDIRMPVRDGFDVVRAIPRERLPHIVFVTAFDAHAIPAFDVNALDYILKPVDPERLRVAVDRIIERVAADSLAATSAAARRPHAANDMAAPPPFPARLTLRVNRDIVFVPVGDIDRIEAAGNYVRVHAGRLAWLHRGALRDIEQRLDPARFVRVNRSTIVGIDRIARVEPWFRGEYRVVLQDDTRLTTSRAHSAAFKTLLIP